jgi:UDP-N-acetylglucosamine 2-epimerase
MLKALIVYGTRPDAIKMAPVVNTFKKSEEVETVICTTAQHRQTVDMVNGIFKIKPDYDMDIMKEKQSLEYITASIMDKFGEILEKEKPGIVLVHGDTTTCLACALAAFYKKMDVGHVEAGLRTDDMYSPFPEEMNRRIVSDIASIHFAPTESNRSNLLRENIDPEKIFVTGNTGIDALGTTVREDYRFENDALNKIDYSGRRVVMLTAHRRENLGPGISNICDAVLEIYEKFEDVVFVYPVHPNPAVRNTVMPLLSGKDRIVLTDFISVSDSHNLISRSHMVMTDSGGLQEEAPAMGKPVLVLRRETERPEAVEMGTVKLTGVEKHDIVEDASLLLTDKNLYNRMSTAVNPYGDGHASERILAHILDYLKSKG